MATSVCYVDIFMQGTSVTTFNKRSLEMKIIMTALALVFMVAAAGCDGDGNGGSVSPATGNWHFTAGNITSDTCNYPDPPVDPSGDFHVQNNGDGTLLITPGDGTPAFTCTLSGSSLSCPDRYNDDIDASPLAAIFHIHASAQGTFSSDTALSGSQTADVTCDGAQCDMAAAGVGITVPCSYSQNFTASFVN